VKKEEGRKRITGKKENKEWERAREVQRSKSRSHEKQKQKYREKK
jgi:hypothetical protein